MRNAQPGDRQAVLAPLGDPVVFGREAEASMVAVQAAPWEDPPRKQRISKEH